MMAMPPPGYGTSASNRQTTPIVPRGNSPLGGNTLGGGLLPGMQQPVGPQLTASAQMPGIAQVIKSLMGGQNG